MEYAQYSFVTRRSAMPGSVLAAWYASWFWYPLLSLFLLYTLLLFPTGHLPSPRWRALAWGAGMLIAGFAGVAAVTPTLGLQDFDDVAIPNLIGIAGVGNPEDSAVGNGLFVLLLIFMVGAVLSLLVRFRRSRGQERLQFKWFTYAATLVVVLSLAEDPLEGLLPPFTSWLALALLPGAVGVAVMRYRLYEFDRIISRTVSYALITAVLVGVYVLVTVVPATMFDLESDLLAAGATLAAAAAFGPVRGRVQRWVDRRFNRSRYDALRTADAFRARLRHTVDLEDLSTDLLGTVGTTVQPAHATVWLRRVPS